VWEILTAPVAQTLVFMFGITLIGIGGGPGLTGVATIALKAPVLDPWWQPITATYGHVDWEHFFSNAVVVGIFGTGVAYTTTTLRFHAFFLVTGVVSSMVQVAVSDVLTGEFPTVVIGSSGAGFALIGYVLGLVLSGALGASGSKRLALAVVGGGAQC
jgi:Rhomboid family.